MTQQGSTLVSAQVDHWLTLCRALNVAKDPQEIVDVIVQSASIAGLQSCTLFYVDIDGRGAPEVVWTVGEWQRSQEGQAAQATQSSIGQRFFLRDFSMSRLWTMSPDKPLLISDVQRDGRVDSNSREVLAQMNIGAVVMAPLLQAGRWVGLVMAGWDQPHPFTEEEGQLFSTVQVLAAASVENLRLLDDKNRALDDLRQKLETIERQAQAIQELSTPVIEIWDDVLVMPVVGIVDTRRSKDIMDSLLHRVVETQSKCAIIDVTGVEIVDTMTADYLLKVVRASRLLGARCVLTGLTPAVAQTLIETGADMSEVPTLRNLKEGLRDCLRFLQSRRA